MKLVYVLRDRKDRIVLCKSNIASILQSRRIELVHAIPRYLQVKKVVESRI